MPDTKTTAGPRNEWKETVRSIFDMIVLSREPTSPLERRILCLIQTRHHDYFCAGKTLAEWEQEKGK